MARAMNDSGVEWIGEIPEGWSLYKIKSVISKRISGEWGGDISQDGTIIKCYRIADFDTSLLRFKKSNEYTYRSYAKKIVEEKSLFNGAILIEKSGGGVNTPVGRVVLHDTDEPALFSNFMDCLKPSANVVSKWLLYFLHCFHTTGNIRCYIKQTTGIQNLSITDYFANEYIPIPSLEEQQRIADYLDTQIADIDASIAKTQESIEEYKKLKQAVITQAVTKGIRPGRAMKDSGVEWIGEIPENWEMDKAIRLWKARKGSNAALLTSEYCGQHHGPYPVYSGQTENDGIMGMIDSFAFDVGDEGCLFSTTVGAKAMSVAHLTNKFSLSQNCMIMQRENSNICVRYFYFFFTHEFAYNRSLIPDYMQPSFRVKDFNAFPVLLPSYEEQHEIAAYLDEKCAAIDTLIEKKQAIITELEAYKKSLIYEYVTGKKEVPMVSC